MSARPLARLLADNPVCGRLVGLTPVIACSDSLSRAAAMAGVLLVVLPATAFACSLTRHLVPARDRLLFDLVLIAGIVSLCSIALQRFALPLHGQLGVYLPVLSGSALVWILAGEALQRPVTAAVRAGVGDALAAAAVLLVLALVRAGAGLDWLPLAGTGGWPLPAHAAGGLLLSGGLLGLLRLLAGPAADTTHSTGGGMADGTAGATDTPQVRP